jgi:hypothetical protein
MVDVNAKESPFSPGRPVPVEYFVARNKEIERIERAIRQASSGRNENIFIFGERGIGKSSLAGFTRYLAEKEHGFVGAHCFLEAVKNLEEAIKAIFQRILEECSDKSVFEKFKGILGRYIKGVTLFGVGVEFTDDKSALQELVDNFLPAMRGIYEGAHEAGKQGLLLVLDDLNGITDLPEFSRFLKSFVDSLATSNKPLPLLLILVGIPERREDLLKHQPSISRIFDVIELPLMDEGESKEFFTETFGKKKINITDDALALMVEMAGGYPMLMHEVGDAVFWQDQDGQINLNDARQGIFEASRNVGRKYIGTQVAKVFKNPTYLSILLRMGKKLPIGATFVRQELLKDKAPTKEGRNLDNFLDKVEHLGIMKDAERRGEYRFVHPLYHLYIWYIAQKQSKSLRNGGKK